MCVIAIKDKNIKLMDEEKIKAMWSANSDGAGFMWAENGKVHIRKGFLTLAGFMSALNEWSASHDSTATPLIMHFRIGTHGNTKSAECTHPFPVSAVDSDLCATEFTTSLGFAHNGIITDIERDAVLSDTMMYGKNILAGLYNGNPNFYKDKASLWLIENTINGSRMCFMDGSGEITKVGDWKTEDGICYSNTHFQMYMWGIDRYYRGSASRSKYSKGTSYYSYYDGWYDDFDYGLPSAYKNSMDCETEEDYDLSPKVDSWYGDPIKESELEFEACGFDKMDINNVTYVEIPHDAMLETVYGEWLDYYEVENDGLYADEDGYVYKYEGGYFYPLEDIMSSYTTLDDGSVVLIAALRKANV